MLATEEGMRPLWVSSKRSPKAACVLADLRMTKASIRLDGKKLRKVSAACCFAGHLDILKKTSSALYPTTNSKRCSLILRTRRPACAYAHWRFVSVARKKILTPSGRSPDRV